MGVEWGDLQEWGFVGRFRDEAARTVKGHTKQVFYVPGPVMAFRG